MSMQPSTVLRERPLSHRCRCAIPPAIEHGDVWDRCPKMIDNPDQPVCDECEREHIGRHGFEILSPLDAS